mmetsp:Transcript_87862/g.251738  ORF Transcript_87862/g.251738 Transcript_87862/m.251738 type:complete len:294 (-) Transcript_87862:281-1162(-)
MTSPSHELSTSSSKGRSSAMLTSTSTNVSAYANSSPNKPAGDAKGPEPTVGANVGGGGGGERGAGGKSAAKSTTVSANASSGSSTQVLRTSPSNCEPCKVSHSSRSSHSSTTVASPTFASSGGAITTEADAEADAESDADKDMSAMRLASSPPSAAADLPLFSPALGVAPSSRPRSRPRLPIVCCPPRACKTEAEAGAAPLSRARLGCRPGMTMEPSTNMKLRCVSRTSAERDLTTVSTTLDTIATSQPSTARCRPTSSKKSPTLPPNGTHCTLEGGGASAPLPACHSAHNCR